MSLMCDDAMMEEKKHWYILSSYILIWKISVFNILSSFFKQFYFSSSWIYTSFAYKFVSFIRYVACYTSVNFVFINWISSFSYKSAYNVVLSEKRNKRQCIKLGHSRHKMFYKKYYNLLVSWILYRQVYTKNK